MALIDLSHPVESGRPGYPGLPAPRIEAWRTHAASRADYGDQATFEITRVFMVGNAGTYLDSPRHRFEGGRDVAAVPLEALAGLPGLCLDLTPPEALDLPDDARGHAVLLRTGWDVRWGQSTYWSASPAVDRTLAERLVAAGVSLVGIDGPNVDDRDDPARPAHTVLLAAGIPIVEHLRGLAALPPRGFRFTAVPPPIVGATSFPVRAFAELDEAGGF